MNNKSVWFIAGIVGVAALSRLIPHPPNFTPVAAMALFAGAVVADRRLAFIIPLAALLLSDLIIGFHSTMLFVYLSVALMTVLGFALQKRRSIAYVLSGAVAGSVLFFALTNFGVWLVGGGYENTFAGLVSCYIAAIPFFHNTLLSTLLYTGLLFAADYLSRRRTVYS